MNTLSILILAGDVAGRFGGFAFAMVIVLGVTSAILMAVTMAHSGYSDDKYGENDKRTHDTARSWLRRVVTLWAVFAFLFIVLPSKTTFYMVAASQVGERVVNTPEVQEILESLRVWLRKQINQ